MMNTYTIRRCFEFDNRIEEYYDAREGVLLDNYIARDRFGVLVAVFETYVSPWVSCYTVYEAETEDEEKELWEKWDAFTDAYDTEYPPVE